MLPTQPRSTCTVRRHLDVRRTIVRCNSVESAVFASLEVALEKVGDVVEAPLRVRFLGEVFCLRGTWMKDRARSWLAASTTPGRTGQRDVPGPSSSGPPASPTTRSPPSGVRRSAGTLSSCWRWKFEAVAVPAQCRDLRQFKTSVLGGGRNCFGKPPA